MNEDVPVPFGVTVSWIWRNSGHIAGFATREAAVAFIDSRRADPEYSAWIIRPQIPDEPESEEEQAEARVVARADALEKALQGIVDYVALYGETLVIQCGDFQVPIDAPKLVEAIHEAYRVLGHPMPIEGPTDE